MCTPRSTGSFPATGPLDERRHAWRERHACPGDKAVDVLAELLPLMRARTLDVVDLPEGESPALEPVSDEPWWAFNYYLGDLASRVVLNIDLPTTGLDLIHLAAHEVYPGHHTESSVKEQLLAREQGRVEQTIALGPDAAVGAERRASPRSAPTSFSTTRAREEAYAILRRHGVELADPELGTPDQRRDRRPCAR